MTEQQIVALRKTYFMVTDLARRKIYILETWSRRSKKLHATSMPAVGSVGDSKLELRCVPLYVRKAARAALFEEVGAA